MTDIFVSYARSDQEFVTELVNALTERGRKEVWVDLERIPPTAEWLTEIFQAIESADNALFVLSPAFLTSEICAMELQHALSSGKRLIPVVHAEVEPASVPEPLRARNWLYWREQDNFDDAVTRTLDAIEMDFDWIKVHTRILLQAREWRRADDDKSRLISGRALAEAEKWLSDEVGHDPAPTEVQRNFIDASRRHATVRQRIVAFISAGVTLVAVLLALWGFQEHKKTARRSEVALARNLIVKANAQPDHRPELRAQLAIEAVRRLDALGESTQDAVKALREARSFLLPIGKTLIQNDPVTAIRFSSDGAYLGTLDSDNAVRLWSTTDWTQAGHFTAPGPIQSFAVARNGRPIGVGVEAFDEVEGHVYDLTQGTEIVSLSHPDEALPQRSTVNIPLHSVLSIALLSDAERVITGGLSSVRMWSIADGAQRLRADGGAFATGPIVIGADDTHVSVQMLNHDCYVFSLKSGERIARVGERMLGIGVKGDHLLWGEGARAKLNARSKGLVAELTHDGGVNAATFSPDGRWMATGAEDGSARLWLVSDGRAIARMRHEAPVTAVAFSPDASLIAIGGRDGRLQIRPADDSREPLPLPHQSAIRSLALSRDGQFIATGTEAGEVRVWNSTSGRQVASFEQTHAVRGLAFSVDGEFLASLDINATHMWHITSNAGHRHLEHLSEGAIGYKAMPWTLDFSSDGRYLAIGGSFSHTILLDFKQRKKFWVKATGTVVALRFLKKPHNLLAASDLQVKMLDLERGEIVHVFSNEHPIAAMEVSDDNRWLAVADRERNLRVWDLGKRKVLFERLLTFVPTDLAFSHDAWYVAVMGEGTSLSVFSVPVGEVVLEVGHVNGGKVEAMAFSGVGPYLATAGDDQIIRIWNIETGTELEQLEQDGVQTTLAFSPDGRYLFIGGTDHIVRRWLWRRHDLVGETCARLTTPTIARDEWRAYLGATPFRETCPAGG